MSRKIYGGAATPTTLSTSLTNASTSITVANTAGYPTAGTAPFVIVIGRGTSSEEKVLIASVSGTTFTVDSGGRGYDSTIAQAHSAGETVEHCLDAATIDEANDHVNTTTRDDHTQYLTTTRHDVTARHTFGSAFATPSAPPAVATSGSAGSAGGPARSDHTHAIGSGAINSSGMFASGVVTIGGALAAPTTPSKILSASATGSSTKAAREDHVHGLDSTVIGPGLALFGGIIIPNTDGTTLHVNGSNQLEVIAGSATVADGSITAAKLASNAVTTVKVTDANITGPKLAAALPRGVLGRTSKTTDQASISSETTITSMSATITPETSTRKLRVYVSCPRIAATSAGTSTSWVIRVKRGTSVLCVYKGTGEQMGVLVRAVDDSPGAGPFVYSASLELTGGSGTLTWEGDSTGSSYIEVVDEGGS